MLPTRAERLANTARSRVCQQRLEVPGDQQRPDRVDGEGAGEGVGARRRRGVSPGAMPLAAVVQNTRAIDDQVQPRCRRQHRGAAAAQGSLSSSLTSSARAAQPSGSPDARLVEYCRGLRRAASGKDTADLRSGEQLPHELQADAAAGLPGSGRCCQRGKRTEHLST